MTPVSKLYVQFASTMAPRLNSKEGTVECIIDNIYTSYLFIEERRLEILIPKSITSTTQFKLTIRGITQHAHDAGFAAKRIIVGLSRFGVYNSIERGRAIPELEIASAVTTFPVLKATI